MNPARDRKAIGGRAGMGLPLSQSSWIRKAHISPTKAKTPTRTALDNPDLKNTETVNIELIISEVR